MAESDWDTVTVLRKKGPSGAQAKSKQVSRHFSSFLGGLIRAQSHQNLKIQSKKKNKVHKIDIRHQKRSRPSPS